jgi:hypothetical protein
MAKCAAVRDDHPYFLDRIDAPDTEDYAAQLGLTDAREIAALKTAARRQHAASRAAMRALYVEVGGDSLVVDDLPVSAMDAFVTDQLDPDALADAQRRLAEERAGMRDAPTAEAMTLEDRLWRARSELGNGLEQQLARELGVDRAHEIRALHDGWPGDHSVRRGECTDDE